MSVTAIILAAGKSTRMKSRRPKPLHEVCGRPMLWYVLQACYEAGCSKVMVVVGHGKNEILNQFADDRRITWIEQTQQLGTAHAVGMCESHLSKHRGDVLVVAGDAPLLRGEALKLLQEVHGEDKAAATLGTAVLENPSGYARILRDADGEFLSLVDEEQADDEQKAIHEILPACYCLKSPLLFQMLPKLKAHRKTGEYRLTDLFALYREAGKKVVAVQTIAGEDVLSVNTRQQLADIDLIMQDRLQRQAREAGVTIVNAFNTYLEAGVSIGQDTVIHPFSFIGRDTTIGADCVIGPFARIPRESLIPEYTTILGTPAADGGTKL